MINAREIDIKAVENLAFIMDKLFKIPGVKTRVGLDTFIGLIPGLGDIIGVAVSGYIVHRCKQLGLPKEELDKMNGNVVVDLVIGVVPVIGDIFDWQFKSNIRNAEILRAHYEGATRQTAWGQAESV